MYQRERRKLIVPFLLPASIFYLGLIIVPMALTIYFSFTNWSGESPLKPFAGLLNYRLMTMDLEVPIAAKNSLLFAVIGGAIIFPMSLFISWALTQKIRFKRVFRYIIISPLVLSLVIISLLWKMIYNPVFGPINNLLKLLGLGSLALNWLGDPSTALVCVVIVVAWQQLGQWVLFICAGMERIPSELLESAKIDGANDWQSFTYITLPLLWGILRQLFILWIVYSLKVFTEFFIMLPQGGVAESGQVAGTLIYTRAFESNQFGFACALATSLMLVIFLVTTVVNRLTTREVIEY